MNAAEAKALVSMLPRGLPGLRFPAESLTVYEGAIADLDAREAQSAIETILRTWTLNRTPFPGDIRKEIDHQRAERTRLQDSASAAAATRRPSKLVAPTAGEWGAVLPAMLEQAARWRKMTRGKEDPGAAFLELAQRGSRGEPVLERVKLAIDSMIGSQLGSGRAE